MTAQTPNLVPEDLLLPTGTFRSEALESFVRVRWFIRLRWVAVVASFILVSLELWLYEAGPGRRAVLGVIAALALINLCWMAWSKRLRVQAAARPADETQLRQHIVLFAKAQIATDLLLLTLVLHYYGPVSNPMAMFYVFHMVITSLLLTPTTALLQGIWAMALYGLLLLGEYSGVLATPYPLFGGQALADLHTNPHLVVKSYAVVCIGVFATWHLTSQVAAALDEREREVRTRDQALERSYRKIEEMQARRARFMHTAAHQLKSPLTGIQTMAKMICDGVVDSEGALALIEKVIRRCKEAIEHIEELLTLARIKESPSTRHRVARTDLANTVATVVERHRPMADVKGITVHWEVSPQTIRVQVDARDLEDCLGNLLDNAIKYTPDAGRVEVSCACEADQVIIRVRDNGPGIAPEVQKSIFDEFRRGHYALAAGIAGSGLGLSIVREIVEQADGSVTVKSPVNQAEETAPGSEFEVRFPAWSADEPQGRA